MNDSRIYRNESNAIRVPVIQKEIAPAYIEVGSGSFQDAPSLSRDDHPLDNGKTDFEIELMEKLADAANDTPSKYGLFSPISLRRKFLLIPFSLVGYDQNDSFSSSSSTSTITRPLQTNHSIENTGPYPDSSD